MPPPTTNGSQAAAGWTATVLKAGAASVGDLRARMGAVVGALSALRRDSWSNTLTGLNTGRDKTAFTLPFFEMLLTPQMLEVLYHTDDIAARIVSALPDECFREPWQIVSRATGDDDDAETSHEEATQLESDFAALGVRQKMREAMTWGRLYGLGAILVGADDGLEPWEPLDWERVREIRYLTVLDKRDLVPWRWYTNVRAPHFGDVALYQVQPVGVYLGASYEPYEQGARYTATSGDYYAGPLSSEYTAANPIILVHESRLVRFGGELTSKRERLRNQSADYSILQKCFRALQLTNNNWQSASVLLADASQGVFKVRGLIDMIAQQPDVMTARMELVDRMRSVLRAIVLDAGDGTAGSSEDFTRVPSQFTGIPEMLQETWKRLAAAARMPLTVLMGVSPAGMNATGESDRALWYDSIGAAQREQVLPPTERLLRLFATARGFAEPENWTVKFAPLWKMKPSERGAYALAIAQRDHIYIDDGVWLPDEVALARDTDPTGETTPIDVDTRKTLLALHLQQEEDQARQPPPEPGALTDVHARSRATPGAGGQSPDQAHPDTPDPRPSSAPDA